MKLLVLIVCVTVLGLAASLPAKKHNRHRLYFSEEDDPNRLHYLVLEDEHGNVHVENLLEPEHRAIRASKSDVTFNLFTHESKNTAEIIPATNFASLLDSKLFQSNKKTKFIIHGWNNNKDSPVNSLVKNALFEHHDINIFVVDWSGPANKFYTTSKGAVPVIGKIVGEFINFIIETYGVTTMDFSLVGHSLGAHVAGCAGTLVKEKHGLLDYIVGLDPASPMFTINDISNRVDPSDAQMVHIIHTNGGFLGFKSSIGDADYFPNGGSSQPGCGIDLVGTCAHARAYEYFAESVKTSGFISHICEGMNGYDKGHCLGNEKSWMGEYDVDRSADGDYFLRTNKNEPFALGDVSKK